MVLGDNSVPARPGLLLYRKVSHLELRQQFGPRPRLFLLYPGLGLLEDRVQIQPFQVLVRVTVVLEQLYGSELEDRRQLFLVKRDVPEKKQL